MTFKCKMCGGDIEPIKGTNTGKCLYCKSIMTLPNIDNERILNLYNRANDLRLNNEFDKSREIYETILKIDSDKNTTSSPTTVIHCDKPNKSDLHPTMKPIKLLGKLIINSSKKDELIVDLFGGSGSTLIASHQLERICYTMELDPHYCDVIIERWQNLTGEEAIRSDGIKYNDLQCL